MCERICGNCTKFEVNKDDVPEGLKKLSRDTFWNKDGTQKEVGPLGFLFAFQTSGIIKLGSRGCEESFPSPALSSAPCIHPKSFEPKE
jgi:hypothetical protein